MAQTTTTEQASGEYEITTFTLTPDALGPNQATLVHARSKKNDGQFYKAVLYIHGYSDYFFHDHVCVRFLAHGYDFFALDLRKCGRSIISPAQDLYRHYFRDIHEYDEEINLSIEHIIKQANNKTKKLILYGHSTGGLIASIYGSLGLRHQDIDAIILNSPYLSALDTSMVESVLIKTLGRLNLSKDIPDNGYNQSIHVSKKGEWNFDANKKPIDKIRVHGASFAAIRLAQENLAKRGSCIKCPILVMCSNRSLKPNSTWRDEYYEADLLLNVDTTRTAAANLGSKVTIYQVDKAAHDLFLSKEPVRENAFRLMFRWIAHTEDDWNTLEQA